MTTTTFFFIFIPLLAFILLAVNLIAAPHNPYQEKDSVFECGFHSFLGQNRTQFTISFFIFALLFLLFDLEILLVYPYIVSAYTNSTHGLIIMLIFFSVLTIGFVFELGKKALKIDSRQVFSLPKVQVTITRTALSGFFSWDLFAIFRGLFKIKYLKAALKKVFGVYTVFIMLVAFTVTTMIRIYIMKHQPQFPVIENDFVFYISSITTIFTATCIRKYFQLFNHFFESIEWHSVYDFFTCSKTDRSKVLQDFIKSLEQFNNEKIKVNNFEEISKDNVSSTKPFNIHDINNTVSQMKKAPSNSLIKASGSGNNDASSSGASGSGNNDAIGSSSANNKEVFKPIRPAYDLAYTKPSNAELVQQQRAMNIARPNRNHPLTVQALRDLQERQLREQPFTQTVLTDPDIEQRIQNRTVFSPYSRASTPFSTNTTSTYQGPLNNLFAPIAYDCTPMWLKAIENIDLYNTHVEIDLTNLDLVKQDVSHLLKLLIKIRGNVSDRNIFHKVGSSQGDRVIHGILKAYPYIFDTTNTREPTTLEILMHIHMCLEAVVVRAYEVSLSFAQIERWMYLSYKIDYTINNFKEINPAVYAKVEELVSLYGDPDLKEYFSNADNAIHLVLTSLHNTNKQVLNSANKYETLMREIDIITTANTGETPIALAESDEIKSQANVRRSHLPSVKCRVNTKFSIKRDY